VAQLAGNDHKRLSIVNFTAKDFVTGDFEWLSSGVWHVCAWAKAHYSFLAEDPKCSSAVLTVTAKENGT
jgi:hypothetical protein